MNRESSRDEWVRLMLELASSNREAYRKFRAAVWNEIAREHHAKSEAQLKSWNQNAS